ncbi:hypothetical protein SNEBB_005782 [Seison nebaliae]|nr:hypothetical protein SNEBB_005782 [Seison nebaliae]
MNFYLTIILIQFVHYSFTYNSYFFTRYHSKRIKRNVPGGDRTGPCSNPNACVAGTCEDYQYQNQYICHCIILGKIGTKCSQPCPLNSSGQRRCRPCDSNPCFGSAVCIDVDSSNYRCVCPPWRVNNKCSTIIGKVCSINPCQHGKCNPKGISYSCSCSSGWTGKNCDTRLGPPCSSNPCQNGGRCIEQSGYRYTCQCINKYFGNNCQYPFGTITPCSKKPCLNEGTCISDDPKTYRCECIETFGGPHCEISFGQFKCKDKPCQNGGRCFPITKSDVICYCKQYYIGKYCEILDLPLDACRTFPCLNKGVCIPNGNEFRCECPAGYTGSRCELTAFTITPKPTGVCLSNPCKNNGACIVKGNTFECICPSGFVGNLCETKANYGGQCRPNPCQHSGVCYPYSGGSGNLFRCECGALWSGKFCETFITELTACTSNPCRNKGKCEVDSILGYICRCPFLYTGRNCEIFRTNTGFCLSDPCQNGGICLENIPLANDRSRTISRCICKNKNFSGFFCETKGCVAGKVCQNGGECVTFSDGKRECNCINGFSGPLCTDYNLCLKVKCQNGATCYNGACDCVAGFTGTLCDKIDEKFCQDPAVCKNGGSCEKPNRRANIPGKCRCLPGYTGSYCDKNLNGKNCFSPETSTIMLENGERELLKHLQTGDKLIGNNEFIGWIHFDVNSSNSQNYLRILVEDGFVDISSKHLIKKSDCLNCGSEFVFAEKLERSHYLITSNGEKKKIDKIEIVEHYGALAPLTTDGIIYVNDIESSCYALYDSHKISNILFSPIRSVYKVSGVNLLKGNHIIDRMTSFVSGMDVLGKTSNQFTSIYDDENVSWMAKIFLMFYDLSSSFY